LDFVQEEQTDALHWQRRWPKARWQRDDQGAAARLQPLWQHTPTQPLRLLVSGSNFQLQVWRALLKLGSQGFTDYGSLAAQVQRPAAARAVGIPARVGYADVRNHLSTERMRQMMQTDLFIWHGYTDLWIDGAWRKATPAFNLALCERFDLLPLEFDGHDDSIYHPFDKAGNRHMEYVHQRGAFDDMPLDTIVADFVRTYPIWLNGLPQMQQTSFLADVDRESR
jgi:hypothetical protein